MWCGSTKYILSDETGSNDNKITYEGKSSTYRISLEASVTLCSVIRMTCRLKSWVVSVEHGKSKATLHNTQQTIQDLTLYNSKTTACKYILNPLFAGQIDI